MIPLFPNTPNGAGRFDVTLSFDGRNINVENFFWESSRSLTVHLPSYAEIVGVNHGPHRTLCKISVIETSLRSDPPLVWRYTYEHTQLLEKISMLETLNVTLKDLVHRVMPSPPQGRGPSQILGGELNPSLGGGTGGVSESMPVDPERTAAGSFIAYLLTTPRGRHLQRGGVALEAWADLAAEHDYLIAETFLREAAEVAQKSEEIGEEPVACNLSVVVQESGESPPLSPSETSPSRRPLLRETEEPLSPDAPQSHQESQSESLHQEYASSLQWAGVADSLLILASLYPEDWLSNDSNTSRRSSVDNDCTSSLSSEITSTSNEAGRACACRSCALPTRFQLGASRHISRAQRERDQQLRNDDFAPNKGGTYAIKPTIVEGVSIDMPPGLSSDLETEEPDNDDFESERSLCFFSRTNPIRMFCKYITEDPRFDTVILSIVALYCIFALWRYVLECPLGAGMSCEGLSAGWYMAHLIIEATFITIFALECITKVIAHGFMCSETAYLKQPWNGLDFAVLLIATIQFLYSIEATPSDPKTQGVEVVRGLRFLAVLEPCFRPINRCMRSACRIVGS